MELIKILPALTDILVLLHTLNNKEFNSILASKPQRLQDILSNIPTIASSSALDIPDPLSSMLELADLCANNRLNRKIPYHRKLIEQVSKVPIPQPPFDTVFYNALKLLRSYKINVSCYRTSSL